MEAGLQDHEVIAVNQVDDAMFLADASRLPLTALTPHVKRRTQKCRLIGRIARPEP